MMKRYDLVTNYGYGDAIAEMEPSDDGEWVRYEDVVVVVERTPDVQAIAAIAWECIKTCKDYSGPPVMCPAHQEQARMLARGVGGSCPVSNARVAAK
jgi:hypothetical protein